MGARERNAQFAATLRVKFNDETERSEALYFCSADLSNVKAGYRRAAKTAKERVAKKLAKQGYKGFKLVLETLRCVG